MGILKRLGTKLFGTQAEKNTPEVVKVGDGYRLDMGSNHIPGSNYGTLPANLGGIPCHVYVDENLQIDGDGNIVGGSIVEDVI